MSDIAVKPLRPGNVFGLNDAIYVVRKITKKDIIIRKVKENKNAVKKQEGGENQYQHTAE